MSRRERQRRKARRRGHPVKRVLLMGSLLAACALVLGGAGVVGWVLSVADSSPNINQLQPRIQGQISTVYAANGERLGYISSDVLRSYVAGSAQPQLLRNATIAIEDRRFWHHGGVDYYGIVRAGVRDVLDGGDALQGGSTLTMQLVKNVYLPTDLSKQDGIRYKIVQAKLANQLEDHHSKSWILTQYLNDVPYTTVDSETAIGVGAASQMLFDEPVQKLDLPQIALLAGLTQAPSEYNPFLHPALARWRRAQVLEAMVQAHYITAEQGRAANAAPLGVHANTVYQSVQQPYVFDYVRQQLVNALGQATVDAGGLKVYTTINLQDQAYAKEALEENEGYASDPAAALVSVNPANGEIVAMAQNTTYGVDTGQTTFDYATQSKRQTGSAFKTFVLMTLIKDQDGDPNQTYYVSKKLEAGWLPQYPTYSVETAEHSYQGVINVTKATTLSDNTVFAQLGVDLGMSNVSQTAYAMGVTSKQCDNPAEAIGGLCNGVSPLQMADAYATLADGGVHRTPTILAKVVLPNGTTRSFVDTTGTKVFTDGQAYAGTQVLKTVVTSGTGTAASYGCPAAGKTGTTSNYTDAWFVGYAPNLSTAVWVGYPDESKYMEDVNGLGAGYGGTLAAPIWRDFMESAEDGYCADFLTPSTPWTGTPYFGAHAVSSSAATQYGTGTSTVTTPGATTPTQTSGTGNATGTGNGTGATGNGATGNGTTGGTTGGTGNGAGTGGAGATGGNSTLPPAA